MQVRSFLHARGSIGKLVMGSYVLQRRACPLQGSQVGPEGLGHGLKPLSAGPFLLETSERVQQDGSGEVSQVRIQMPTCVMSCDTLNQGWIALTDELEAEILASCDGQNSVQDIVSQLVTSGSWEGGEGEMWEGEVEEVTVQDVVDRLSRLYQECLVSF